MGFPRLETMDLRSLPYMTMNVNYKVDIKIYIHKYPCILYIQLRYLLHNIDDLTRLFIIK